MAMQPSQTRPPHNRYPLLGSPFGLKVILVNLRSLLVVKGHLSAKLGYHPAKEGDLRATKMERVEEGER